MDSGTGLLQRGWTHLVSILSKVSAARGSSISQAGGGTPVDYPSRLLQLSVCCLLCCSRPLREALAQHNSMQQQG